MYSINRKAEFYRLKKVIENLMNHIEIMKNDIQDANNYKNTVKTSENKTYKCLDNIYINLEESLESLKELLEPFLLFIIGSGNYGKSTLINALVEEDLVKTKDLPNTWKLDLFCKSKIEKIMITYANKTCIEMTLEDGINYLDKEEEKFNKSRKKILKVLKEYKDNNKASVSELKEYKNILKEKYLYISDIVEVKYYFNKNGILKDFIVVDTPGLNQILNKSILNSIEYYYQKSDGIIWVIDAQNIISKKSNEFINDINKLNNMHDCKKNMILAVNKMDIIEDNNEDNVTKVKEKVNEIYRDKFDDIIFISAKEAVKGRNIKDEDLINKSKINNLINSINKYFKENSEKKQVESKKKNLSLMSDQIIKTIEIYKRELYKDISKYNKSKLELNEKVNYSKEYVNHLLLDMKNTSYYKEININDLEKQLKEIEIICNNELNKLWKNFYKQSNFTNQLEDDYLSINIHLTKNKNLIADYSLIKSLNHLYKKESLREKLIKSIDTRKSNNSKILYDNELFIKSKIQAKFNTLIKESINEVNEKFSQIETIIKEIRESSFKKKYMDYRNIEKHIKNLDMVYNILKSLR
ncbi:dynamin family protein [Romboutsia hominis]|uniref:Dynamin family protein n=1 Tax=Romboutsia faecis TaxID=2764597 RepID=A0ABR7JJR5_9FIRM|nr:dynamin family protein [Romboutsia faecis]MBC5995154.1 dynamin family protein [Romboutsia faecis]